MFICFAAKDRYTIAESIVYHLKNYGIKVWYDRLAMVMGDNRQKKNLDEGATKCKYVIAVISKHTANSKCLLEELSIVKMRYYQEDVTVFPILYEVSPDELPHEINWMKNIIFKEVNRHSGTREICNHIACKITSDYTSNCRCKKIQDIIDTYSCVLPSVVIALLNSYEKIDNANLNSRVSLLYATYITIVHATQLPINSLTTMTTKIYDRLFAETRLNLEIDYREIWLLENTMCILIDYFLAYYTESKI